MRKLLLYGLIIFELALIVSLVRGIQLSSRANGRIEALKQTKAKLVEEGAKLDKEAEYIGSEYYLEKVARDELHLGKAGETVVIVPDDRLQKVDVSEKKTEQVEKTNWQKWWGVLSGSM